MWGRYPTFMIAVILSLIIAMVGLARRGGPKRVNANLFQTRTTGAVAMLTTASQVAVSGTLFNASDESYRLINVVCSYSTIGVTVGEGPIVFGIAHGDYSDTEITEAIVATSGMSRGDMIARERSRRLVRIIGSFSGKAAQEEFNDGRQVHTKLNWLLPTAKTVKLFAFNDSGNVWTTGGSIQAAGRCLGRW